MNFKIESWTIQKLVKTYEDKKLNLTPPYQRNNIWTEKAQSNLISSIKNGMPIPTFFLHEKANGEFDVADGQQRTRAILAFEKKEIPDIDGLKFDDKFDKQFLEYQIPIVIINSSVNQEKIREFYVMVNNTGLKLNKPELTKAKHFTSSILSLVEELTGNPNFKDLGIFNSKQSDRMIDREFVEELVAQLKFGIGDKKNDIKKLYTLDISQSDTEELKKSFNSVLELISRYNKQFSIAESRYIQRNDFYTLFKFISDNTTLNNEEFSIFFQILLKIQYDISPSNEKCPDLQFYAYNCVSQSNSKQAREERLLFFTDLLLNKANKANKLQKALLRYYGLKENSIIQTENYLTINPNDIQTQFKK